MRHRLGVSLRRVVWMISTLLLHKARLHETAPGRRTPPTPESNDPGHGHRHGHPSRPHAARPSTHDQTEPSGRTTERTRSPARFGTGRMEKSPNPKSWFAPSSHVESWPRYSLSIPTMTHHVDDATPGTRGPTPLPGTRPSRPHRAQGARRKAPTASLRKYPNLGLGQHHGRTKHRERRP
jgi:hypothetical protein